MEAYMGKGRNMTEQTQEAGNSAGKAPKVSVILPVYNAEEHVRECLDSLLGQSLKDVEILCTDRGSTDGSAAILREYAARYPRIRVLEEKISGLHAALNAGLREAVGEYVYICGAHDYFDAQMLETMYLHAAAERAQVCVCAACLFDEAIRSCTKLTDWLNAELLPAGSTYSAKDIADNLYSVIGPDVRNKLISGKYLREIKLAFPEGQDTNALYFGFLLLAQAACITVCKDTFVTHREAAVCTANSEAEHTLGFYVSMLETRAALKNADLLKVADRSFVNYCLHDALARLDAASSGEAYSKIYRVLQREGFEKLGMMQRSRKYFDEETEYERMLAILNTEPEIEAVEEMKRLQARLKHLTDGFLPDESVLRDVPLDGPVKVSVIIPVYNTQAYLEECLDSVLAQTLKNIEILCVDDGSTDASGQILTEYAARDSRIRVLRKKNGGQSSARNLGLKEASGAYVLFLDSDDLLEEDALRTLYCYAAYYELDQLFYMASVFYESPDLIDENANFLTYYNRTGEYTHTETGRSMFLRQKANNDFKPSPCLQLLRHAFLTENALSFYEGIIHEDELFTLQCISLAKRVRVLNAQFYRRRVRAESTMTSAKAFKNIYGYYVCVREMLQFIEAHSLGRYTEFQIALLDRLYDLSGMASNLAASFTREEIMPYIHAMDEKDRTAFVLLVYRRSLTDANAERKAYREKKHEIETLRKRLHMSQDAYKVQLDKAKKKDKEISELKKELNGIKESRSYKLGRKLTAPGRRLRGNRD